MAYIFHKLADNWELLTDVEKEELFKQTNYLKPSLEELIALNKPFKLASFDGQSGNKSVYLKAVPHDKLFIPTALFGTTFETVDSVKVNVTMGGGDVSLIHFDNDFIDSITNKSWIKSGNVTLNNTEKKFGDASLYLDGMGYIYSSNSKQDFNFGDDDFSVEMWVYPLVNTYTQTLFSFSSEYHGVVVRLFDGGIDNAVVYYSSNGASWNIIDNVNGKSEDSVITLNTWNHIALVRNNQYVILYINGVVAVKVDLDLAQDTTMYFTKSDNFQLGAYANGTNLFTGLIDEVRIAKGLAHYNKEFIPASAAFVSVVEMPKIKFALTKDLSNYFTFEPPVGDTSGFKSITPFSVETVLEGGMDSETLENISSDQWDMFFNGTDGDAGLGIAFAISQDNLNQQVSIDNLMLQVDMKGEWRSAHKGEDFEYGYPNNNVLRIHLLTDGDYKINYQNMVGGM